MSISSPTPLLRNSRGEPDGMWTLVILSLVVFYAAVFFLPSAAAMTLSAFTVCAGGYYGRKRTDRGPANVKAAAKTPAELRLEIEALSMQPPPPRPPPPSSRPSKGATPDLSPEERDGGLVG